ncbi:hypothetical protein [Phenylobacterium sp.]|uniref:hypothetical protein n=1 Tax=Phenylobacterium sp. TaxID=1871053 RepID=UPI002ED95F76
MRHAAPILAAALALTGLGPAKAQPLTPDQADARCLMVLQFISRDPKQQDQAAKGIFFYLGRLSARGPTARIEGLMRTEAPKLQAQVAQTELARCAAELNARGKELQAVNQRLAASARPAAAPALAPAKK